MNEYNKSIEKRTLKYDLLRNMSGGFVLSWSSTFGLIVLLQFYSGSVLQKSIIVSSPFIGMTLSLFTTNLVSYFRVKKNIILFVINLLNSFFFLVAAFSVNSWMYLISISLAIAIKTTGLPILTSIFHDNYRVNKRGKFVSYGVICSYLMTTLVTWLAGFYLDKDLSNFRYFLIITAISSLFSALICLRIPSNDLLEKKFINPLKSIGLVFSDKLFGRVILAWFLFGFANLWSLGVRLQYLNDVLHLSTLHISIIFGVIPEVVKVLFTPIWAFFFDRYNFVILRILLNVFLLLGIYLSLSSTSIIVITLGFALYGMALAGGRLTWTLWVTKMTPKNKSHEYMSVHVFFTGVRGIGAPFIGFYLISTVSAQDPYSTVAKISVLLISLSIVMLIPLKKLVDKRT